MAAASGTSLDQVVVTATRTPQPADESLSPVIVITHDEIARSLGTDVADLLRMHAGVEISRPGGIGQSVSVFIRGANAAHTLVLLDGVRMNPGTIGTASLQNIPPESIERIEIVKGPRSAIYGSDAIGGVINIITRKRTTPGLSANAEAGYGSYDTRRASGSVDWANSTSNAGVNVSRLTSDGFPTLKASTLDSGYDNLTIGAHAGTRVGSVDLGARFFQATGTADYLNVPTALINQDYTDRVSRLDAASQINNLWHTKLVLSRMDNVIDQNQPVAFPAGEMDYLETHRNTVDWQNDLALDDSHQLTAGVMYAQENAHALSYGTYFDRDTDITNLYVQHQLTSGAHTLLLAAGYTDYSTFGGHTTWNADYGYDFGQGTRLVLTAGSAFHAPTATDLYGFGGNPALSPENSRTYEIGLHRRFSDRQSGYVTAFQNTIDDLITFDTTTFVVRNIARARIRGVEAHYELSGQDWNIHADVVYQNPRDLTTDQRLLRRASRSASLGYSRKFGILEIGGNILYSGTRLDSQFPGTVELDDYWLANINARVALSKQWSLVAQIENAFNSNYVIASGYRTAGRNGSLAIRWNLN